MVENALVPQYLTYRRFESEIDDLTREQEQQATHTCTVLRVHMSHVLVSLAIFVSFSAYFFLFSLALSNELTSHFRRSILKRSI